MDMGFLGERLYARVKVLTGTTELEEAIPILCSQNNCNLVEDIITLLASDGAISSSLYIIPLDVVVLACHSKKIGNDIYVMFITSGGRYWVRLMYIEDRYVVTLCNENDILKAKKEFADKLDAIPLSSLPNTEDVEQVIWR